MDTFKLILIILLIYLFINETTLGETLKNVYGNNLEPCKISKTIIAVVGIIMVYVLNKELIQVCIKYVLV